MHPAVQQEEIQDHDEPNAATEDCKILHGLHILCILRDLRGSLAQAQSARQPLQKAKPCS